LDHLDNTVSASVVGGDVRQQHLDLFIKKIQYLYEYSPSIVFLLLVSGDNNPYNQLYTFHSILMSGKKEPLYEK